MSTMKEDIAEIRTDVQWLKTGFGNHLRHHWAVTLACLTIALGSIATALITLLK